MLLSKIDYNPSLLIAGGFTLGLACVPLVATLTGVKLYESEAGVRLFAAIVAPLAGVIAAFLTDGLNRRREAMTSAREDTRVVHALYAEIYNRAARCALDYRSWLIYGKHDEKIALARFQKFRPEEPVIYTSLAGSLGRIRQAGLGRAIIFYTRLDALRREFEIIERMLEREQDDWHERARLKTGAVFIATAEHVTLDQAQMNVFTRRYAQIIEPALAAIEALRPSLGDQGHQEAVDKELMAANEAFIGSVPLHEFLRSLLPSPKAEPTSQSA